MSPRIDTLLSQRHEDKNRDKTKTKTLEKDKVTKIGPPLRKSDAVKKVSFAEPSTDNEKSKEPAPKGRALPYVDVPPLRATLRTPVKEPIKEDQTSKTGPNYKTRAPVEVGLDIEKLVETVLDLEISVPLRSLAGVSGAIQKEIRKQVTKTRWPTDTVEQTNLVTEARPPLIKVETLPVASYMVMTDVSEEIPEGHMVADDPVLQYLLENKDAAPEDLIVAKHSEPLRAIYMNINQIGQEECLFDSGSMIVSMSKETAVQLGLTWDPTICINMESASNHLEKTLGLARNVRFTIGGLDIFLQVHILESPPYRVLLGRPFDSFTSSVVQTKSDGSSELILTDPNNKRVATVPTYERGVSPDQLQRQRYQSF